MNRTAEWLLLVALLIVFTVLCVRACKADGMLQLNRAALSSLIELRQQQGCLDDHATARAKQQIRYIGRLLSIGQHNLAWQALDDLQDDLAAEDRCVDL